MPMSTGAAVLCIRASRSSVAAREWSSAASPTAWRRYAPGTEVRAPRRPEPGCCTLRTSIILTGESSAVAHDRISMATPAAPAFSHRPKPRAGTGSGGSRWIWASRAESAGAQVLVNAGGGATRSAFVNGEAASAPIGEANARWTTGTPRRGGGNGASGGVCNTLMLVDSASPTRSMAVFHAATTGFSASMCHR